MPLERRGVEQGGSPGVRSAWFGKPARRKEDFRLLTGRGTFADDVDFEGQLFAVVLRCPYAHARPTRIDVGPAQSAPGVRAVLTGADYLADGLRPLPSMANPPDLPLKNVDGSPVFVAPDWPLVTDKSRRAGEGVALIVADSRSEALDAAELVAVEYEELPAVADARAALAADAPLVWEDAPGNLCANAERGDRAATDDAFARADHIVEIELYNNRINGTPMEPRAAVALYDPGADRYELHYGGQGVTLQQSALSKALGVELNQVRAVSRDVGGNFGIRSVHCREHVLISWAAKRLGRPVKWTSDRSESFLIDTYGRDLWARASLALDDGGRFLALRAEVIGNIGAQTINLAPLSRSAAVLTGVYDIPCAHVTLRAVFTNTIPISTYRGAGRPEGIFTIERLVDKAARVTGIDPAELRRRNLIPVARLPFRTPTGTLYDSGEFAENMGAALAMAEWEAFPGRRESARRRGRLRGIGIGNYIETATGIPFERVIVEVKPEGRIDMVIGTAPSGQGHETSFAQVLSDMLAVDFDSIDVRMGDTDFVKMGGGSNSSRSMRIGTLLLDQSTRKIIARGRTIAAHILEVSAEEVEYADGAFKLSGTDLSLSLFEVAARASDERVPEEVRGALVETSEISTMLPTFPNGCHVCEVEIDPETGQIQIVRYVGIDDVGRIINPMLVDGQTQGGIVQGLGQAWMEDTVHADSGQMLTGTFMDYAIPRAEDVPFFELQNNEVPAPNNPLGIKGAGEGGTTGAPAAMINAIVDALSVAGVDHVEMPATPERIWRALRGATGAN